MKLTLVLMALSVSQSFAFQSATVSPIEQPSWASASDVCLAAPQQSCDNCQDQEYCKYTQQGQAQCCSSKRSDPTSVMDQISGTFNFLTKLFFPDAQLQASIKPDAEQEAESSKIVPSKDAPEAESAKISPSKDEMEPESAAISPIKGEMEPESASVGPIKGEMEPESASVGPIKGEAEAESGMIGPIKNGKPSWASSSDVCKKVSSCDDCDYSGDSYCTYSSQNVAKCCGRISLKQASGPKPASMPAAKQAGSIRPIEFPAGASASDVCKQVKSCDSECDEMKNQYCRWTSAGKQTCCQINTKPSKAEAAPKSDIAQATISPIVDDKPAGASAQDKCSKKRSCDACASDASSYCFYSKSGVANCCQLSKSASASASVKPSVNEPEAESATVRPNQTPMEPESAKISPSLEAPEPESASVGPIKESGVPSWASASDVCMLIGSCDSCHQSQYCKYIIQGRNRGKASCCGPVQTTQTE